MSNVPSAAFAFHAVLQQPDSVGAGRYFCMPFDMRMAVGTKGQVKVTGSTNGHRYHGVAMPMGNGTHFVVASGAIRDASGARARRCHLTCDNGARCHSVSRLDAGRLPARPGPTSRGPRAVRGAYLLSPEGVCPLDRRGKEGGDAQPTHSSSTGVIGEQYGAWLLFLGAAFGVKPKGAGPIGGGGLATL